MTARASRLWSKKEVAEYFGVSEVTVQRMIQNGDLTAYKIKGRWKLKEEDIEQHLRERSSQPQPRSNPKAGRRKASE